MRFIRCFLSGIQLPNIDNVIRELNCYTQCVNNVEKRLERDLLLESNSIARDKIFDSVSEKIRVYI